MPQTQEFPELRHSRAHILHVNALNQVKGRDWKESRPRRDKDESYGAGDKKLPPRDRKRAPTEDDFDLEIPISENGTVHEFKPAHAGDGYDFSPDTEEEGTEWPTQAEIDEWQEFLEGERDRDVQTTNGQIHPLDVADNQLIWTMGDPQIVSPRLHGIHGHMRTSRRRGGSIR